MFISFGMWNWHVLYYPINLGHIEKGKKKKKEETFCTVFSFPVKDEVPWCMLSVDDIVLLDETWEG